jgi:hypothetical protein
MHLLATVIIAYLVMCWLDGRSLRRERRRREQQLERALAEIERQDGEEPWL